MHLSAQIRYAAGTDQAAAMLADERFVEAKVRATGAVGQQADVVRSADGSFTVTTRRQMPTEHVPAQFRSFLGSSLEVRQVEAWEAPSGHERRGTVAIEVTGAPVRLTGTMRLVPDDGGTVHHYDGELKASIPLFASAVEEATARAVRSAIEAEERAAAQWLAG